MFVLNCIGLYVHIPFCLSKCPYCDFYSSRGDDDGFDHYTLACGEKISDALGSLGKQIDTVYFGGGTPSVIGSRRLSSILDSARDFLTDDCEITAECNPSSVNAEFFSELKKAGFNRVSMGMQSAVDAERRALGRLADSQRVSRAVSEAISAGFDNISLDLMLGVPGQTLESLRESLNFCLSAGVKHISIYILKLEEGTAFYSMRDRLVLPDEDAQCELYNAAFEYLERHGYRQYEISNASLPGYESRHNLKYWNGDEYLGIGPAAHSFIDGKRFYYPRDLEYFIGGGSPIDDGDGGSFDEYLMLRLRLAQGLTEEGVMRRFGFPIPEGVRITADKYKQRGLLTADADGIRLTRAGFLLSNTIIADLI